MNGGTITAIAPGSTTVSASLQGVSGTSNVTVVPAPADYKIVGLAFATCGQSYTDESGATDQYCGAANQYDLPVGGYYPMSAVVQLATGARMQVQEGVFYSSSDPTIFRIADTLDRPISKALKIGTGIGARLIDKTAADVILTVKEADTDPKVAVTETVKSPTFQVGSFQLAADLGCVDGI